MFKSFHSGERFQKFAVTVCVFAGYVWTKVGSATKCLRIQTNPDTCGQGLYLVSTRAMRSMAHAIVKQSELKLEMPSSFYPLTKRVSQYFTQSSGVFPGALVSSHAQIDCDKLINYSITIANQYQTKPSRVWLRGGTQHYNVCVGC